ncbi:carboxypeptidase-like regulatory domain-containing protein [Chitinophaga sedimenti]|uniref:carboxypeptidase-like regulatory domain-containing protein n=1 Tax=Chitinophaga sedimenti TaxID=2033606 RepID=UPI00200450F2|nr:carboxypeptidase-like regulatory domain-containing protein [Chitinophaga sedimenti]MCK7553931.1 carboxypeptidase-like regulatory domain-containing protein [Chitinophaga sedimenti]
MRIKLRIVRLIAVCLFAIAISSPVLANVDPLSAIKGKVVTSDGSPAAYVSVQVKEKNRGTMTNEKGEFVFRKLPAGRYTVQVYLIGYKMSSQEVEVNEDQITTVEIQLEATNAQLRKW